MSTEPSSTSDLHLPFALIALAIVVLLASQIGASKQAATIGKWQIDTLDKQITNLEAVDKQAADAIKNREELVKKSGEIQNQLQSLLNDMLDLSDKDKDKDAMEIIKKYGVQRNQPPTGAPAAAAPAAADKK